MSQNILLRCPKKSYSDIPIYPTQMSQNLILLRCPKTKKENAVPNETRDEMEPRRSGKSAAQKARDLHLSAGT